MNYKKIVSVTTLSVIAVFAITSFTGLDIADIDAATVAVQPEKFVFVEKISTTAIFSFRDGTEIVPIQLFSQSGGFGTTTLNQDDDPKAPSGVTGRAKPAFTMEKIAGGTPLLYHAADQAQRNALNAGMEYPFKFFDVEVLVAAGGDVIRSFKYKDCQITNYVLVSRADNEEGYTGKGFAVVDQYAFECSGYTPGNPAMDTMKKTEHAKTISSSDLKSTSSWEHGFYQK
ncbi:MAG: hypothetical protein RI100_01975 [Nitrosarchaeum sp.]|jgi:hypothetical protein|uniref:hypothetical protein n=1 Tax=Nitrosarchaeum sp. TaxID=2026886 RepID=UPI002DF3159E|nr:hypothetical protein [Nitrosarchaeum sp.]